MTEILVWPHDVLIPAENYPNIVPFTRTGGRALGGAKPSVRTDLGFWTIDYVGILLHSPAQLRVWEAIKDILSGSSGRIAVPIWVQQSAPWAGGPRVGYEPSPTVPHDDDTPFDDGTEYEQGAISIETVGETLIGATVITLRAIAAGDDLSGVFFSYEHALYRTGRVVSVDGNDWTMRISPSIRQTIPAGATLEFDIPTCLVRLVDDDGMNNGQNINRYQPVNVSFEEDTQYWNLLAIGAET